MTTGFNSDPFGWLDVEPAQHAEQQINVLSLSMKYRIVQAWHDGYFTELNIPDEPGQGEIVPLNYRHTDRAFFARVRAWKLSIPDARQLKDGYGCNVVYVNGKWMPGKCDCQASYFKTGSETVEYQDYWKESCKHSLLATYIFNKAEDVLKKMERETKSAKRKTMRRKKQQQRANE